MFALAGALLALTAVACSRPPATGACRPVEFDWATVQPAPSSPDGSPLFLLWVTGVKPAANQTVKLVPVTYIRQPEFWRIDVVACDPAVEPPGTQPAGTQPPTTAPPTTRPAPGRYQAAMMLRGSMGTKGIEVAGINRTQRFDLATDDNPDPGPQLNGNWHVTGVVGRNGAVAPLVEGTVIGLGFRGDGSLDGRACNSYRASWRVDGSRIVVSDLGSTRIACASGVADQENRYFDALRASASWRIDRNRLVLSDAGGRALITAERGAPPRVDPPPAEPPERPTTTTTRPPTTRAATTTTTRPATTTTRPPTTTRPAPTTTRPATTTTRSGDHGDHDHDGNNGNPRRPPGGRPPVR